MIQSHPQDSLDSRLLRRGGFAIAAFIVSAFLAAAFTAKARADGADDQPPGPPPGHHRQPPPAAFDACKGKKAADTCQVAFPDHTVNGTCTSGPANNGELFCRPEHPPGPPPEVFAACDGKNEGDACSVTFDGSAHAGKCTTGHGGRLVCRP